MRKGGFLAYFIAGASPRLAMFVILFLLARLLPLAETGLFVLVVTVGEILEMTLCNWVRLFILNREAGRARIRSLRAGRIGLLTALTTALAILIGIPVAFIVVGDHRLVFLLAVAAYIVAFGLLRLALTLLQVTGNHARFAAVEMIRGIFILAGVMGAAIYWPDSYVVPSLALSLTTFLAAAAGLASCASVLDRPRMIARGLRTAGRFGLPIIADTILNLSIVYFDRFVLNQFLGPASVGIYAIAYALGRQPVDFIAGPLNNLAVPVLFSARVNEGEARAAEIQTGLSITLAILCAGILTGMILLRDQITQLLLKPEYWAETSWLLPIITASACLTVFKAFLFDNVFHMFARNQEKLRAIIPAAVAGMAVSLVLVWGMGLHGAAIALFASNAFGLAASVIASRRFFRFDIPVRRFVLIGLAAVIGGLALQGGLYFASAHSLLVQIAVASLAFCVVYAVVLTLQGVSLKSIASTPWAPVRDQAGTSAR